MREVRDEVGDGIPEDLAVPVVGAEGQSPIEAEIELGLMNVVMADAVVEERSSARPQHFPATVFAHPERIGRALHFAKHEAPSPRRDFPPRISKRDPPFSRPGMTAHVERDLALLIFELVAHFGLDPNHPLQFAVDKVRLEVLTVLDASSVEPVPDESGRGAIEDVGIERARRAGEASPRSDYVPKDGPVLDSRERNAVPKVAGTDRVVQDLAIKVEDVVRPPGTPARRTARDRHAEVGTLGTDHVGDDSRLGVVALEWKVVDPIQPRAREEKNQPRIFVPRCLRRGDVHVDGAKTVSSARNDGVVGAECAGSAEEHDGALRGRKLAHFRRRKDQGTYIGCVKDRVAGLHVYHSVSRPASRYKVDGTACSPRCCLCLRC